MHIYIYIYTYTYIFSTCILYTHHIYINLFSHRFAASQFAQVVRNGISLKTVMLVKTLHTTMTVGLILENPETFFYHRPCRYDFLKYHCKNQIVKIKANVEKLYLRSPFFRRTADLVLRIPALKCIHIHV